MAWIDAAKHMAYINAAVFGEPITIVKGGSGQHINSFGIVYLPDTNNTIGSVRTDFESPRVQVASSDAGEIEVGDVVEVSDRSYTIYQSGDDDISDGLTTFWMRQNAD